MSTEQVEPHKSSLGLNANIVPIIIYIAAALLLWIPHVKYFAWLIPLIFYFIEKESTFTKFHAAQAFVLSAVTTVLFVIVNVLATQLIIGPVFIGNVAAQNQSHLVQQIITYVLAGLVSVLSIFIVVKAVNYESFKIPLLGNWAEKLDTAISKSASAPKE